MSFHPERLCEQLAAVQYGLLATWQIYEAGLKAHHIDRRIRSGRWRWERPGVVAINGAPHSWHQSLMGACLSLGACAVASHRSAAVLWDLDGWEPDLIEVAVPSKARRENVIVHRLPKPAPYVSRRAGIPVTDPTCTILDLAAVASGYELERALDSALRKNLTHLELLHDRLDERARRGRNGIRAMRRLLDVRDPHASPHASGLEVRFARFVRTHGLPKPVPQYVVRDGTGLFVARPDFAYVEERVAIELQSYAHHHDRPQWEKDQSRAADLSAIDWLMVPVTDQQLSYDAQALAAKLLRILSLRSRH